MYAVSGEALSYPIRFMVENDFVVPDLNSVKVTIRGQTGSIISGWNKTVVNHNAASAMALAIDGPTNTVTGGQRERRSMTVEYSVGALPYKQSYVYYLTPYLNIGSTPEDVRRVFGVQPHDLSDDEISLEDAYYEAIRIYDDKATLDAALIDPDKMKMANQLLVAIAAQGLFQAVRLRINKIETADKESFTRFDIKWDTVQAAITQMGTQAADVVFARTESSAPTMIDKATPTDVITGV